MKQLNFFEAMGVQILDAAQHEKNVKENKRKAAKIAKIKDAHTPKEGAQERKGEPLAPTWEVHLFDTDGRQRMVWERAKDEEKAKAKALREWGARCTIFHVTESRRTLEEIEALA